MARRKKKKKNRPAKPSAHAGETLTAEGVTVAWMLSAMGTGATELVALLSMAALAYEPIALSLPERADVLPWLLLFVAVITGTITLVLTPLVLRRRRTPPPSAIVNFAIFVGVVAWTLAIGSLWFD